MHSSRPQPLIGKTIVVTRPLSQAHQLADQLDLLGAAVYEFATIDIQLQIAPLPHDIADVDWVVFTSANAVRGLKASMSSESLPFRFPEAKLCAVGPATRRELEISGLQCDLVPEEFTAEHAFAALNDADSFSGKRVLLPQGNIARQTLAESLREAGARVDRLVVYDTVCPIHDDYEVRALIDARPDLVTFTSASTAQNFALAVQPGQLPSTEYASIGPQTTVAAEEAGLTIAFESKQHDIPGLIDSIIKHYS